MQLFATFVKKNCNFLVQQKLALVISYFELRTCIILAMVRLRIYDAAFVTFCYV